MFEYQKSDYTVNTSNIKRNYWENPQGYITLDRRTLAVLIKERPSVERLFKVIVSQAFTRAIPVKTEKGDYEFWGEGSRPWSLRQLGEAANLSVNTIQYGLHRLKELGLIKRISNKLGTIIQALNFYQYRRKNPHVGADVRFNNGSLTPQGDTRRSPTDNYRSDFNIESTKITSIVDVPPAFSLNSSLEKPKEEIAAPGNPKITEWIRAVKTFSVKNLINL